MCPVTCGAETEFLRSGCIPTDGGSEVCTQIPKNLWETQDENAHLGSFSKDRELHQEETQCVSLEWKLRSQQWPATGKADPIGFSRRTH